MQHSQSTVGAAAILDQPYKLRRSSIVMRPRPDDPLEVGGVLNPAGVRAPNGEYLLFPRLVARGNYSRIGVARVIYDAAGLPSEVERQGIALEPDTPYERNTRSGGGCEDARISYIPALGVYVMTYVAYGPIGPRAAIAISTDLYSWRRAGLIEFGPYLGADMNIYSNKDALFFPEPLVGPDGRLSLVLMHRPMYEVWTGEALGERTHATLPPGVTSDCWTMWLSYCPLDQADWATTGANPASAPRFDNHHLLLLPEHPWEAIRLGGGTPPIRLPEGWFTIYHGIGSMQRPGPKPGVRYTAGALVLDAVDPRIVTYRSPEPILEPMLPEECAGVVADVVFPTAVDKHDTYVDVYYGMADACIGAARMDIAPK